MTPGQAARAVALDLVADATAALLGLQLGDVDRALSAVARLREALADPELDLVIVTGAEHCRRIRSSA